MSLTGRVTKTSGIPVAGEQFSYTAKTTATGGSTDDILYGVLGSASGDIYSVKQMDGLGNATVSDTVTLPPSSAGKILVWDYEAVINAGGAKNDFRGQSFSGKTDLIGPIFPILLGILRQWITAIADGTNQPPSGSG